MEISNTAYITDLDNTPFGNTVREARKAFRNDPNNALTDTNFVCARIIGKSLNIDRFEVGTRFGTGIASVSLSQGESAIVSPLEGELEIKTYDIAYARTYSSPLGQFYILVPTTQSPFYVIQTLPNGRPFIQWAEYKGSGENQKIYKNADCAVFQHLVRPINPLVAIVDRSRVFMMGESLIGAPGHFKEIKLRLRQD